ncbi:hypothetical protein J1614_003884 [Plenodomus biglobosus]|nr:hypothetical protein J1614_003884 [Plenodomus biglobosus]
MSMRDPDVEFAFEKEYLISFDRLLEDEVVALLQPVSYLKVNSYTPDSAWPKLLSWLTAIALSIKVQKNLEFKLEEY